MRDHYVLLARRYFISGPQPNPSIPAMGTYGEPSLPLPPELEFRRLSLPVFSTLSPLSSPVTRSTLHILSSRRCCLPASREVLSRSREPWLREGTQLHESQASPLHSDSLFPPSPQLRMLWALTELCSGGWDKWWWWWEWGCTGWGWDPATLTGGCCCCWLLLLLPLAPLLPPLLDGRVVPGTAWWWWWWLLWWWLLPQLLAPRPLLAWWYWVGDEVAEEGEVEGWFKPPLDPTPPLPDFSFKTSSSRLSLLPRPLLISIPCWVVMVYTRAGWSVHSTHFCWSSSTEKLRSSDSRAGLAEAVVMEGGRGWSFTELCSGFPSEPVTLLLQGWRLLLLFGPTVSVGDSGSGPAKVSQRRWAGEGQKWELRNAIDANKQEKRGAWHRVHHHFFHCQLLRWHINDRSKEWTEAGEGRFNHHKAQCRTGQSDGQMEGWQRRWPDPFRFSGCVWDRYSPNARAALWGHTHDTYSIKTLIHGREKGKGIVNYEPNCLLCGLVPPTD